MNQTNRYSFLFRDLTPCWCILSGTDACYQCKLRKSMGKKYVFSTRCNSFDDKE